MQVFHLLSVSLFKLLNLDESLLFALIQLYFQILNLIIFLTFYFFNVVSRAAAFLALAGRPLFILLYLLLVKIDLLLELSNPSVVLNDLRLVCQ